MKKIAIRELAYFVCQSGDLTTEFFSNADTIRGQKAHDFLQSKYNEFSSKEVYIKKELTYLNEFILLHGFIDGVLNIDSEIIIEEIKSTTKELDEITAEYHKEHLAQLKIYGYLYALEHQMDCVHLRLTYVSVVDYEVKSLDWVVKTEDLEEFTFSVLEQYLSFLNILEESEKQKEKTIKEITFPFSQQREGQRDLMKATFQALSNNEILYVIAPTGIGKTMATLFSALKTLKKKEKLFYLTAKGSGKNAPVDAVKILKEKGLKMKTIDLVAKRKICNAGLKNCNPEECPFALGYFDRLKEATMDIFAEEDLLDKDTILKVANRHTVCAFEFSLYISYFCDLVIADYNYVFDPHAQLIRYFQEQSYQPKVLVDEAHNLISRSKEMYSAILSETDIRILRARLTGLKPSIRSDCNKAIELLDTYRPKVKEEAVYCSLTQDLDLGAIIKQITLKCDQIFDENKKISNKDEVMEIYFKLLEFNTISEIYSANHRMLVKCIEDQIEVHLFCLDASDYLLQIIQQSIHGIVFFSATLYPIEYHCNLLTKGIGKYLELPSPFPTENLDIIIHDRISTKYKNRKYSIDTILESIECVTKSGKGNYIVYFPSYQYLKMVTDCIENPPYECIIQTNTMTDDERQEIIEKFKTTTNIKVGFFVMGGVFSEGIDFMGDALSGVIIVGVGLPMICDENNILKDYFQQQYHKGFDYAYVYPGFTKVIQAVGRVIRSATDRGIAVLLDERFSDSLYMSLMPPHWKNKKWVGNSYELKKELDCFYNKD